MDGDLPEAELRQPRPEPAADEGAKPVETAKAAETTAAGAGESGLPPLIRPRSLSSDSTRLLRAIGEKLKNAPPLPAAQKVAAIE